MISREFVIYSNEGRTKGDFNPNRLDKAGRLDIIVNSIIQGLFVSERIRFDTKIHLVLNGPPDPPKYILISPKKETPFSKKDLGTLLKIALNKYKPKRKIEALPGIYIEKKYFEDVIDELENKHLFLLDKNGVFIDNVDFRKYLDKNMVFILGDHLGLPKKEKRYAIKKGAIKISLGNVVYFTSQCLTILNFYLDKILPKKIFLNFKTREIEEVS